MAQLLSTEKILVTSYAYVLCLQVLYSLLDHCAAETVRIKQEPEHLLEHTLRLAHEILVSNEKGRYLPRCLLQDVLVVQRNIFSRLTNPLIPPRRELFAKILGRG